METKISTILLKIQTLLDDDKQEEERKEFERKLLNSQSGIMPIDLKQEYIPLNVNPTVIDKNTLEFVERKILNHYGVSLPIINGDFTDEQYQAFYEKSPTFLAGSCRIVGLFFISVLSFID